MSTEETHKIVPYRTFITVWIGLLALTVITVLASWIDLGALNVWLALAIASVKCSLVIAWFMHLKYENRFLKLIFLITLITLAVFIGLTFVDVLYR